MKFRIRNAKVGSSILLVSTISLSKDSLKSELSYAAGIALGLFCAFNTIARRITAYPGRGRDDVLRLSKMSHECASARPTWGHNVWQP